MLKECDMLKTECLIRGWHGKQRLGSFKLLLQVSPTSCGKTSCPVECSSSLAQHQHLNRTFKHRVAVYHDWWLPTLSGVHLHEIVTDGAE
jgi:hypothetical protein